MESGSLQTCSIQWNGNTQDYSSFTRLHEISFPGGQSVAGGPGGKLLPEQEQPVYTNPEELLAAAVGTCMMMTILAVFSKAQVNVVAYHDQPEALLEFVDRRYRVTQVKLRPRITVAGDIESDRFEGLIQKAHANCFIGVSVKSETIIEPTYLTA